MVDIYWHFLQQVDGLDYMSGWTKDHIKKDRIDNL